MPVTAERPARLRVGVVGAGRVGATLGAALGRAGHHIVAASAVSARIPGGPSGCCPACRSGRSTRPSTTADLVLLAVPDDALRPLVAGLADTERVAGRPAGRAHLGRARHRRARPGGGPRRHRAGAAPGDDLRRPPRGPRPARRRDLRRHRARGAARGAESLVVEMGGEPVWVPESARPLYHAALTVGVEPPRHAGQRLDVDARRRRGRRAGPAAGAAAQRRAGQRAAARRRRPHRAGVARRRRHRRGAPGHAARRAPDVAAAYVAMARRTAERARAAGRLTREQADAVLAVLDAVKVVSTRADSPRRADARPAPAVGLVPTMGALHAGHGALIEAARAECDAVVVDHLRQPAAVRPGRGPARATRARSRPTSRCASGRRRPRLGSGRGRHVPARRRAGAGVARPAGRRSSRASSRPGHFAGMLTVVAKLLNLVRPDAGYFGEKDYQQLTLIRRMVADLDLGAAIVGVPTVREPDGLALSSRNVPLRAERIRRWRCPGRCSPAATPRPRRPAGRPDRRHRGARTEPGIDVDYLALRAPDLGSGAGRRPRPAARGGPGRPDPADRQRWTVCRVIAVPTPAGRARARLDRRDRRRRRRLRASPG